MVRIHAGGPEFEAFADRYAVKDATDQYIKLWFVAPVPEYSCRWTSPRSRTS